MCQSFATKRFRLVEVTIDSAAKNEFSLDDEEYLRNAKRITAIEAYRVANVSNAPSGAAVVANAVFNKAFLTLATNDTDQIQNEIPLSDLCRADNNGDLYKVDIPPLAPTKCKIKVGTTAGLNTTEVFLLAFHYEK